jgi:DNA-binding beta-propeller fold protein YncE
MHEQRWIRTLGVGLLASLNAGCFHVEADLPPVPMAEQATPCTTTGGAKLSDQPGELPPLPAFSSRGAVAYQPWTSGHAVAVSGNMVLAVDADNGKLVFVDRALMQVVRTLDVGPRPEQVVVGPDQHAYVSVRGNGTVVHLAPSGPSSWEIAGTWNMGTEPAGIALDPAGDVLHVVLVGDRKLLRVDAKTGALLLVTTVGDAPFAVAVPEATRAYVTDRSGPLLSARRTGKDQEFQQLPLVQSAWASACDNTVTQQARAARAVAASVEPGTQQVFVAHVVLNTGTPEDSLASLTSGCGTGAVEKKGTAQNAYGGTHSTNACGGAVRPVEAMVSRATGSTILPPFLATDIVRDSLGRPLAARFDQPRDVAHHPTLKLAVIAAQGTDNLLLLDTSLGGPLPVGEIAVGKAPKAVAFSDDGRFAYVLNAQDFTLGEVDLDALLDLSPGAVPKQTRTVAYGVDPLPEDARLGRRTFTYANNAHVSDDAHFACATCHFEGLEDKQTWFIADGPRQTPALAGRLADTAPYNWKGSHDQLTDNMADTIGRMGGTGLEAAELASLQKFLLTGLPLPQNPNVHAAGPTPEQVRGKALFDDPVLGCAGCHVPGSGTDGNLHDVGTANPTDVELALVKAKLTGKPFQPVQFNTPSLRMLYLSAPYLHDGSAATLDQLLKVTAKTMGKTEQLSADQRADLVAYLLTL